MAAITLNDIGNKMDQAKRNGPAPSILAASTRLVGICKNC